MNEESNKKIINVRNNLAYLFRFGGNCSALKFNPSNITNEESKILSTSIITLLNEELWNKGLDIISTKYSNGGYGFLILTTTDNKENLFNIIEKFNIKKSIKNEYIVSTKDILQLSSKSSNEKIIESSFIMSIYDNYKLGQNNALIVPLSEDANTSIEIEISERAISSGFKKMGFAKKDFKNDPDSGWYSILDDFGRKFSTNTKKFVVPALLIIALFYTCQYLWKKYNELKIKLEHFDKDFLNKTLNNTTTTSSFSLDIDSYEPAQPFEPAQPYEPCDYSFNISKRTCGNERLTSLLKTLEDSDIKHQNTKCNNIENKILSLLAETTSTN